MSGVVEMMAAVIVAGAFAWAAWETRRGRVETHEKLDRVDSLLQGDGNGNPGLVRKIDGLHLAVTGSPTIGVRGLVADVANLERMVRNHEVVHDDLVLRVIERYRDDNDTGEEATG